MTGAYAISRTASAGAEEVKDGATDEHSAALAAAAVALRMPPRDSGPDAIVSEEWSPILWPTWTDPAAF